METCSPEDPQGFVSTVVVQRVFVRSVERGDVAEDALGTARDQRRHGGARSQFNLPLRNGWIRQERLR